MQNIYLKIKKIFADEKRKYQILLILLSTSLACFFIFIALPSFNMIDKDEVVISEDCIELIGGDAIRIPFTDIKEVEILEKMPQISFRINGSSYRGVNTGYFMLSTGEKCFLFLRNDIPPFIYIQCEKGIPIFLNRKNPEETREVFQKIISIRE